MTAILQWCLRQQKVFGQQKFLAGASGFVA
jgi:hypothetical protein